jgi:hypothetical protein
MQQRMHLTMYEESATTTTRKIERLRHENAIHRNDACPPSEHDRELQKVYHCLSDTEHGWNYTRMLLDITCERWRPVPAGLPTLSITWRLRTLSLRKGRR